MNLISCKICKKDFYAKTSGKICSDECKKKNRKITNAKYHDKNKNKINYKARKRYKENSQWFRERDKQRAKKEREERELNGEKIIRRTNFSGLSNEEKKDKLKQIQEERNKKRRQQYKSDKLYSLKNRIRSLINKKIRDSDFNKSFSTEQYIGCDIETLLNHLELNFEKGMSWKNREKWHIDHIVPISRAKTEKEFILLSHYTNLQPMWADKNIRKSDKLGFHNVTGKLTKKFGEKEQYQQYRYGKVVDFNCFMCKKNKTAKLIVVYDKNWNKIVCNGCYGTYLSK